MPKISNMRYALALRPAGRVPRERGRTGQLGSLPHRRTIPARAALRSPRRGDDVRASAADQRAAAFLERTERLRRPGWWRGACSSPTAPFDSAGFFTSNRYMSWILRPSARIVPLPNSLSSVGISFILATTALPSASLLSVVDRLEIVRHRRIDAGMDHARIDALVALRELLGELAVGVVQVPVPGLGEDQALRGLQAERIARR